MEICAPLASAESDVHWPFEAAAEYAAFPSTGLAIKTINGITEVGSDIQISVRAELDHFGAEAIDCKCPHRLACLEIELHHAVVEKAGEYAAFPSTGLSIKTINGITEVGSDIQISV